ncbi:MAG: M48 family metalloprotease [Myxococcales bacterium]|nr:M48 family metalloprotease [Myxococcales bacterium]MDH5307599.1 M48 family metalloprotease [Myxococcales bacterium]MDH5567395.1 M48 family metalloprotease [Myxococcales bacterium]
MSETGLARTFLAASALLAFAAGGCLTPGQEAKLGESEAQKVEQTMGLVRDAKLEGYVRAIGEKLAAASERPEAPWHFMIADAPEPNAFALPGGYVYVTRGLLALVNSEDEIAGVIGHEIGHVTARHSAKRIGAAVVAAPVSIATGLAGLAVSIVSPFLGSVVAATGPVVTGGLVIAPFSREQEHAADQIGQRLAARAGYDPAGIATFLHTLDRSVSLSSDGERSFNFLDSHPMTPDRIENTTARAAKLERAPARPVARNHSDFLRRLEDLIVGPDPAQGVFEGQTFLHPELDIAIEFPSAWKTVNTAASVGAISPGGDAVVALRLAARGSSVDETVRQIEQEQANVAFERFEIRGLPAARTRLAARGQSASITLIGYLGNVFAVVGQSAERTAGPYAQTFDATASSFRALRTSERGAIREVRLRVREARAGETPGAIAKRTESTWSAEALAVANAVEVDASFRSGQEIKVALPQAYTPRSH